MIYCGGSLIFNLVNSGTYPLRDVYSIEDYRGVKVRHYHQPYLNFVSSNSIKSGDAIICYTYNRWKNNLGIYENSNTLENALHVNYHVTNGNVYFDYDSGKTSWTTSNLGIIYNKTYKINNGTVFSIVPNNMSIGSRDLVNEYMYDTYRPYIKTPTPKLHLTSDFLVGAGQFSAETGTFHHNCPIGTIGILRDMMPTLNIRPKDGRYTKIDEVYHFVDTGKNVDFINNYNYQTGYFGNDGITDLQTNFTAITYGTPNFPGAVCYYSGNRVNFSMFVVVNIHKIEKSSANHFYIHINKFSLSEHGTYSKTFNTLLSEGYNAFLFPLTMPVFQVNGVNQNKTYTLTMAQRFITLYKM